MRVLAKDLYMLKHEDQDDIKGEFSNITVETTINKIANARHGNSGYGGSRLMSNLGVNFGGDVPGAIQGGQSIVGGGGYFGNSGGYGGVLNGSSNMYSSSSSCYKCG
eukprot:Gb_14750 [translate_table: standard]